MAGLLRKRRQELWNLQGNDTIAPELIVFGCQDHVLNLMSKDYEAKLVSEDPKLCVNSKHRATDVVQFVIAKVFFGLIILY